MGFSRSGRREPKEEIHLILDNLSAHKTKLVEAFLEGHPNVTLHFTPTYSLRRGSCGVSCSGIKSTVEPARRRSR